jgi:cytochrome b561
MGDEGTERNMPDGKTSTGFSLVSRVNHWIVGAAVLALLGLGIVFHDMPRGPDREALQAIHVSIGTLAVLPILFRVLWRVREGFPAPLPAPRWQHIASKIVHWGMLFCLLGLVVSGPLAQWSGRIGTLDVFGWFTIPSPFGPSRTLHDLAENAHAVIARPLLLVLIIVHILAVAKHLVIDKDRTLMRMVTGPRA